MTGPGVLLRDGSRYGNGPLPPAAPDCPLCGQLCPSQRARYCSEACKQRAYRLRHASGVATADTARLGKDLRRLRQLTAQTIYECPVCEERFLGERRCSTCNRFCRSLGLGGACPDCDRLIVVDELLGR